MRYKIVHSGPVVDPVTYTKGQRGLCSSAEYYLDTWGFKYLQANVACVAKDGREVVGFVRVEQSRNSIQAAGTWVHPKYRKNGLALKMWQRMLKHTKPRKVECYIASKNGYKLIKHIASVHPDIRWSLAFDRVHMYKEIVDWELFGVGRRRRA